MAGSAQPGYRHDGSMATSTATSGQRIRPVGLQVPGLSSTRNDAVSDRQMLLLAELIDAERERVKKEELRLLQMLMQEEAPALSGGRSGLQPSENAFSAQRSRKGSKGGKGPGAVETGADQPTDLQVSSLSEQLRRAINAKNWADVNVLINSPEQVWLLACSERGSRQLQQLLKTSSDTEQAAFKSAVDKVIMGLQSRLGGDGFQWHLELLQLCLASVDSGLACGEVYVHP